MKVAFKILLFVLIPLLYIIFRQELVNRWNDIESFLAVLTYWTSLLYYSYNTDLKFHFFILRIINRFRIDHTTWKVSFRAITLKNPKEIVKGISTEMLQQNTIIKSQTDTSLELLVNNNYLLNISFQNENGITTAFAFTSNIVIPSKEVKRRADEIAGILENIERHFSPTTSSNKEFSIDVEYREKSPYYSYWIKKMPEEAIHNFNCSISIPNNTDSKIKVNKNHIIISSPSISRLFSLTSNYISLQAL